MSNDMSMMTDMAISSATRPNFGVNSGMALKQTMNPEEKEKALREASQGFEAIFLQQMWEEMRSSLPENSLHGSKEEKYWQSMYSQYLGEEMAENGGIGLADMMVEQLSINKVKSPSAARIFDRAPMVVSPAPLLEESALPVNPTERAIQAGEMTVAQAREYTPASHNTAQHTSQQVAQNHAPYDMNFYEDHEYTDGAMHAPLANNQADMHNNQVPTNNVIAEPLVTTTRTISNGAGRTSTQTVSMPLSEYQQSKNSTVVNGNVANGASSQQPANTALLASIETEEVFAESYEQASEAHMVQDAMSRVAQNTTNTVQDSSLVRQTLDELQNAPVHNTANMANTVNSAMIGSNMVGSTNNPGEPIVIHTTYRSNMSSSDRSHAIIGKDGKISNEHKKALDAEILRQQQAQKAEQERLAQLGLENPVSGNRHEISDYPESLMALNTQSTQREELQSAPVDPYSLDPLAGIKPRYTSPAQLRMQEAKEAFEQNMMAKGAQIEENAELESLTTIQSVAEVEAEIAMLMGRENRATYMLANANTQNSMYSMNTLLADSTYINDIRPNRMGMQESGASMMASNEAQSINTMNTVDSLSVMQASSASEAVLPVFRSMPSLDVALKTGNLIASLSPEEIRMAQMGETSTETQPTQEINEINPQFAQNTDMPNIHAGGPKFLHPEEAFPLNATSNGVPYVSGVSPEMSMQQPLASGEIHSAFGWRIDPFTQERAWHTGIDIATEAGSSVQAVASGRVIFVGEDADFGNTVIIEHENGMQTLYGHSENILVKEGEEIASGTNIATVGMSGRATGAHLHFEVRHNGLAINPEPYLAQNNA